MIWLSNNQLAGVAWFHHPRRLGLIYCTNRPSKLFKMSLSTGQYGMPNILENLKYHQKICDIR